MNLAVKDALALVVEPDPFVKPDLGSLLEAWGYQTVLVRSVDKAVAAAGHSRFLFTLLSGSLDEVERTEFFKRLKSQGGSPGAIIVISDRNGAHRGIQAIPLPVDAFVHRPFAPAALESAIKQVLAQPRRRSSSMADEDVRLREEMALCCSPKMRDVWNVVQEAARVNVTVLIGGETGTGKDLVARAVHHLSARQGRPFVKVNCAAVPKDLLETELFGHERGAFTGAHQRKIGKFEFANGGTVFLDEIGDLHPTLQGKLLHVLQDRTFSRVGGRSAIEVDVRVLAATNQDLERAVLAGRFREDLYYRLNVIQIVVPPLRERLEEVPWLADYFIQRYAKLFKRDGFTLPPETVEQLKQYRYPGNIRELENIIKRMIVLNDPLLRRALRPPMRGDGDEGHARNPETIETLSLKDIARSAARAAEREAMARVLRETRWNRVRAAKLLSISYRALLYKIKHAGLGRERELPDPERGHSNHSRHPASK